ncbi:MAG: lexA [Candidatus Nomurabacteria bacterium]|nr:lexA [Candidatus Nomurabacteria bacterium]
MKDSEILNNFFNKFKRMPTYEEMCSLFNVSSKNTVAYRVRKMIEEGILEKTGNKLSLTQTGTVMRLGTVQAGFPSPSDEDVSDLMSLDEFLIERKESTYMLEVRGESMKDAGIMEGDLVLVERGKRAVRGDIVLALVENEYTLKYLELENGNPVLVPANRKFRKIYPKPETLKIEAVLKAVIRKYK